MLESGSLFVCTRSASHTPTNSQETHIERYISHSFSRSDHSGAHCYYKWVSWSAGRSSTAMRAIACPVLAILAICILLDGVAHSDNGAGSTSPIEIIDGNSTERTHFQRNGSEINEENSTERSCCIWRRCFTFIECAALIATPLFVTTAVATTSLVYILHVCKSKNINLQKCDVNDTKAMKILKPINSDTTRCTSSGNSSPPTNKTSRSSERQLRPLRNLCDESELSRSIMPSSSSDQEPDERTLNDESPFLK
uniref:Secreted protein n=5 Tax=Parascaris univalens TaxID=6257 RepID=A0A915ARY3_PARUN